LNPSFYLCEEKPKRVRAPKLGPDVLDARAYALSGSMEDGTPLEAAECVADRAAVDPDLRAFLISADEPPQDQIDAFLDKISESSALRGLTERVNLQEPRWAAGESNPGPSD
jgi:hypothetical protein